MKMTNEINTECKARERLKFLESNIESLDGEFDGEIKRLRSRLSPKKTAHNGKGWYFEKKEVTA